MTNCFRTTLLLLFGWILFICAVFPGGYLLWESKSDYDSLDFDLDPSRKKLQKRLESLQSKLHEQEEIFSKYENAWIGKKKALKKEAKQRITELQQEISETKEELRELKRYDK